MKVAVVGSRDVERIPLERYLPPETTEIVSGGARGADRCARLYARIHGIKLTEFLPDYDTHGRRAPLIRNDRIVAAADLVLAFWDGHSNGTRYVIRRCVETDTPYRVIYVKTDNGQLRFF